MTLSIMMHFLRYNTKSLAHKSMISWTWLKLKTTLWRKLATARDWGREHAKDTLDEWLLPKIYKELLKLNNKKTMQLLKVDQST